MESISFYISQYYLSIISFQKKKKKKKNSKINSSILKEIFLLVKGKILMASCDVRLI